MSKTLYDNNSTMYVLGMLLRQPDLIHENKYILSTNDFEGIRQIIFGAIWNLTLEGVQKVTPQDIDIYLKQSPTVYKDYNDNSGYQYLLKLNELDSSFDISQFEYYYERVKKFTILRDLQKIGIDTSDFYDPEVDFTKIDNENIKLNDTPVGEIFNRLRERIVGIEDKHINKDNTKIRQAGEGIFDLLDELKEQPEIGAQLDGDILNYTSRGARLGKFYLYSAPTGHGKTRFFVGQACALSMPYIKNDKIIIKENLAPVLFVATEMDPDEIQTLILAYVSGVNEEKILTYSMTEKEEQLVRAAAQIITEYSNNFIIEKMSDPNISSVRSKLIKYIMGDKVNHIFYDYIFTSPSLNSEFARTGLREDVILMMLANTLKEIASDFGVFVYSGTQVNREWEKKNFRNENSIAGSKAIADKSDFSVVAVRLFDEEYSKIETLVKEGNYKQPNMVLDLYKNRRGRFINIKIFRYFDHGTCRSEDIFATDTGYRLIANIGAIEYEHKLVDLLEMAVNNSENKH